MLSATCPSGTGKRASGWTPRHPQLLLTNDNILVKIVGCYACSVRCKRVVQVKEGPFAMEREHARPRVRDGVHDGDQSRQPQPGGGAKANDLCNRLGMDTIAMGSVIAVLMEAQEMGWRPGGDRPGLLLGNMESALAAIRLTAAREGFGESMARGSRALAEELGGSGALRARARTGLPRPRPPRLPRLRPGLRHGHARRLPPHSVNLLVEGAWAPGRGGPEGSVQGDDQQGQGGSHLEMPVDRAALQLPVHVRVHRRLPLPQRPGGHGARRHGFDMTLDELMECGWRIWYLKRHILNLRGSGATTTCCPQGLTPRRRGPTRARCPTWSVCWGRLRARRPGRGRQVPPNKVDL